MAEIVPEKRLPKVGDIVVLEYEKSLTNTECKSGKIIGDKCKTPHIGAVEGIFTNKSFLISECNMGHLYVSGCGYRIIPFDYPYLIGFHASYEVD